MELILGKGGALGGDGGVEPDRPAADGVELTLDEEETVAVLEVGAGMIHAEEDAAFVEDGGFGGVDVFCLAGGVVVGGLGELTGGEGDDAALDVADWDHEAAPEA